MNILAATDRNDSSASGVAVSLRELIALRAQAAHSPLQQSKALIARVGAHLSTRHSRGMEFAEARAYQPGDDVRNIDWRQTARRGRPYTKLFQEEHERPVQLLVDLGASMRFGTRVAFKSVLAARAAAVLAWGAAAAGDRVGGIVCNGDVQHEIRPQARQHGVLRLLNCMADAASATPSGKTDLPAALRKLVRTSRPGSLTVLVSDFHGFDSTGELAALARQSQLVMAHVHDVFEADAPPGCYRISDGERSMVLDLRSETARAAYAAAFSERRAALEQIARQAGARFVPLATHGKPDLLLQCLHRTDFAS